VVYRQLVNDQKQLTVGGGDQDTEATGTGPEGHLGAATTSCAAGSNPNADASDKSLSSPSPTTLPRPLALAQTVLRRLPDAIDNRGVPCECIGQSKPGEHGSPPPRVK
jgi:hypothetical protein